MTEAADRNMIALEDLANPITYRYNLATSWGVSSQELTLDIPELAGLSAESIALGRRVWSDLIAVAISHVCQLSFLEMVRWKQGPAVILGATGAPAGASFLGGTAFENSGHLMLHTGFTDRFARRNLWVPNMVSTWQADGVLTDAGQRGLYGLAAVLSMGMGIVGIGGPIQWLIAYPDVVDATPANLRGVAFRRVEWIRVMTYCGKAPDEVPLDWP